MSGAPGPITGEDAKVADTGSFADRLKAQAARERFKTEKFPLLVAEEKGDLDVTVVVRRVIGKKDAIRSSRHSDGAYIVECTEKVVVTDGDETQELDWPGVARLMELPASITVDQTPSAVVGGNETLIASVAQDILEWQSAQTERTAARLGS